MFTSGAHCVVVVVRCLWCLQRFMNKTIASVKRGGETQGRTLGLVGHTASFSEILTCDVSWITYAKFKR